MQLKTIVLTFFFALVFTFFTSSVYAQIEWVPGTSWEYRTWTFGSGEYDSAKFWISKDTVVDGKNCVILESEFYTCTQRPVRDIIYQDGQEVFYYRLGDSTFHQLYNFDAQVGDTLSVRMWQGYDTGVDFSYFIVDSIGTVDYGGEVFKKLFIDTGLQNDEGEVTFYDFPLYPFELIEGIGCLTNLFYYYDNGWCDGRYVDKLWCFSHPEKGVYINDDSPCSRIETNSTELQPIAFEVFPNPVNDLLYFSEEIDAENIRIYNQKGILVLQQEYKSQVCLLDLPVGIYYLQLIAEDKIMTARFVKGN